MNRRGLLRGIGLISVGAGGYAFLSGQINVSTSSIPGIKQPDTEWDTSIRASGFSGYSWIEDPEYGYILKVWLTETHNFDVIVLYHEYDAVEDGGQWSMANGVPEYDGTVLIPVEKVYNAKRFPTKSFRLYGMKGRIVIKPISSFGITLPD